MKWERTGPTHWALYDLSTGMNPQARVYLISNRWVADVYNDYSLADQEFFDTEDEAKDWALAIYTLQ